MSATREWLAARSPRFARWLDRLALRVLLRTLADGRPITDVVYDLRGEDGVWLVTLAFTDRDGERWTIERCESADAATIIAAIETLVDMVPS